MNKPESHPAYDFFGPGPLPGYAGNPNNINGWIEADVPLLGELSEVGEPLGAEVDELMVDPMIDEIVEPIVEVEEQMVALAMDMEGDLAVLFGDNDFSDDGPNDDEDDEEVWEVNEEWLMAPVTPPSMPVMPPPSTYEVGGPSTVAAEGHSLTLLALGVHVPPSVIEHLCIRMGNLEYCHRQLVKKVIAVSDTEVADSIAIGEICPRVSVVEGQRDEATAGLSQQVQTLQAAMQDRDLDSAASDFGFRDEQPQGYFDAIIGINVWVKLSEEENVFTPATDSYASNLTPIDCMERVSYRRLLKRLDEEIPRNRMPTLRRDLLRVARFPRWVEAKDQVDYASRGAETLELKL
ncbi:hypothetical protein Tco_1314102 [Tanacetum coccineum]